MSGFIFLFKCFFIFNQIKIINDIDYLISKNHSFYKFKEENPLMPKQFTLSMIYKEKI